MHALIFSLVAVTAGPPPAAIDHRFIRIYNPTDRAQYADTSNLAVHGYLYLPNRDDDPKSFSVRVRLYRPTGSKLLIAHEAFAEVKPAKKEKGVYPFLADIKGTVPFKPDLYVLRVDCRDRTVKKSPIIARQSVFVEVVSRNRIDEKRGTHEKKK